MTAATEVRRGPQTDVVVAERVLGWSWVARRNGGGPYRALRSDRGKLVAMERDGTVWVRGCPGFSGDMAAAWRVVEALRADGWWFSLTQDNTDIWDVCFWRGERKGWFPTVEVRACAKFAPLAICRAALQAVDAGVPA